MTAHDLSQPLKSIAVAAYFGEHCCHRVYPTHPVKSSASWSSPVYRRWASRAALLTCLLSLGLISLQLAGVLPLRISFIRISAANLTRPIVIALVSSAALVVANPHSRRWRWIGWASLVVAQCLGLVSLSRSLGPSWLVGDAALLELNVIAALSGDQLLGAYSQYGWHHPGPLFSYWLAAFYAVGGRTAAAMSAGALFLNLVCLQAILASVSRLRPRFLTLCTGAVLVLLILRTPSLLTSYWNPHVILYPAIAMLFASASAVRRPARGLVTSILLGSFAAQTHVSTAPVAAALIVLAATHVIRGERDALKWLNRGAWIVVLCWWLPLSEQVSQDDGNIGKLLAFFTFFTAGGQGRPPFSAAANVWGAQVIGVIRPEFSVPLGVPFVGSSRAWVVGGVLLTALLPFIVWREHRRRLVFSSVLAGSTFLAAVVGWWSISRIDGPIADHQVFWLAAVGVVGLAVCLASGAPSSPSSRSLRPAARALPVVLLAWASVYGATELVAGPHWQVDGPGRRGETLERQINEALRSRGLGRPKIELTVDTWEIGAGLVLRRVRAGQTVTVGESALGLVGRRFASIGDDDVTLFLVRASDATALLERPGSFRAAESGDIVVIGTVS